MHGSSRRLVLPVAQSPRLRPSGCPLNFAPMRLALTLALLLGSAAVSYASEVEFVRVWPEWHSADSFGRISEYFTGQENTGSQVILRTQPKERAGFYFLARVKNSGPAQPAAKIILHLIKPDAPQTRLYEFPVALPAGETVFNLGLTGTDWAGPKTHPVAWKLEIVATDGRLLVVQKSFLWEKPDK